MSATGNTKAIADAIFEEVGGLAETLLKSPDPKKRRLGEIL
jgi:flavodoxin